MDRSRRGTGKQPQQVPSASRLTVKAKPNRRLPQGSLWSRIPRPQVSVEACGRVVRRAVPALVATGIVCAVGGTAWAGYRFVTTSPRFAITTVEVRGNQQLPADAIVAALPAKVGDNMFSTSLDGIVAELRTNPWVEKVTARRVLPHTIVIDVREHVPVAVVQLGALYLVDDAGHPFKKAELGADDGAGLPIVTGLDRNAYVADPQGAASTIRNALATLARWRSEPERPSIGEVHLDTHGGLTLVTYEHAISIQLGTLDEGLPVRMQTFDATWSELSPSERDRARAIHLDARPDHVTVALRPLPPPPPLALAKDS